MSKRTIVYLFSFISLAIIFLAVQVSLQSPPGRNQPAVAYDATHNQIVVFGGSGEEGMMEDTWIWDEDHWKHVEVQGPSARTAHSMTFSYLSNKIILFGGYGPEGQRYNDIWEWDGGENGHNCPSQVHKNVQLIL